MLREDFLQQSAFDAVDAHCPLIKQYWMLSVIQRAHQAMNGAVSRGVNPATVSSVQSLADVAGMRRWPADEAKELAERLVASIREEVETL